MKFRLLHDSRVVAALLVVLFHAGANLAKGKYFGWAAADVFQWLWFAGDAGVAYFFVLSGFIIHHVHQRDQGHPARLKGYLVRRALRIYPAYWLIFAGTFVLALPFETLRAGLPMDPVLIAKALLLLPLDRDALGGTGAPVIVVAWSLQYEVMFYAFVAVAILNRWAGIAWAGVLVACVAYKAISGDDGYAIRFLGSHHLLQFAMGMAAAQALHRGVKWPAPGWRALFALGAFGASAAWCTVYRASYVREWADMAYGASGALLILSLVQFEQSRPAGSVRSLPSVLGDASYALYLIHYPLIAILCKLAVACLPVSTAGAMWALLLITLACVAAAVVFHVAVERPLIRYATSRWVAPRRVVMGGAN